MRSAQRKTRAKVIQIRPIRYRVENAIGARCAHCEHEKPRGLSVHRIGCLFPYNNDDPLGPCPCGIRLAHVQLETRGGDWLRQHYELRCANCVADIGGNWPDDYEERE